MNRILTCLLVLVGSTVPGKSGEIATMPNPGHWILRAKETPAASGGLIEVSREVWLKGRERYEVVQWSDGTASQLFIRGEVGFERPPKTEDVYVLNAITDVEQRPTSWRELSWLEPSALKGAVTLEGRQCLLYEQGGAGPAVRRVWLEEATRRPVALEIGGRLFLYEYVSGPIRMPALDAKVGEAVEKYEATMKAASVNVAPR